MTLQKMVVQELRLSGWLEKMGAYVILDGQFGSTGKGLLSSVLAEVYASKVNVVTNNAGPNSGHTSYHGDEKVVLQQLPTFGVMAHKMGIPVPVYLNAGAIIDQEQLAQEVLTHYGNDHALVHINPFAAVIDPNHRAYEKGALVGAIGSTGKGVGSALAAKIMRSPEAVAQFHYHKSVVSRMDLNRGRILVEVSQGYSLGINSGFYPYCTSRGCDVGQALADAEIHPSRYRDCFMSLRTYPIRVAGNSGPCYPDQKEIQWSDIGAVPERTTVTNKVRRVFTWSNQQFMEAVRHNRPGFLFVNFLNYLQDNEEIHDFIMNKVVTPYAHVMGTVPEIILGGFGPYNHDVRVMYAGGRYVTEN